MNDDVNSKAPDTTDTARDQQIAVFKALGDGTRLRLLRLLYREELNVQELAHILKMGQPRVSRHLGVLRNAGLAHDRREGTKVFYTLSALAPGLEAVTDYIESLGRSQHPDLERLEECLFSRAHHARSFADHKAEQWDEIGQLLHSSSASLMALAKLAPGKLVVADLGTGTGLLLPFLSALGAHVYAVDQSARMLSQARLRCQRLGIENVTFIQSAVEDLDGQLPLCDGALLHFVLHQVARPHQLIAGAAALLQPRGHLVVVDRLQHQDEKAKTTFGSLWLGFAREQIEAWIGRAGLEDFYWHALSAGQGDNTGTGVEAFVAAATQPGRAEH